MKLSAFALPLSLTLLAAGPVGAEPTGGKELHQTHCAECHQGVTGGDGSELYTRSDRRVNSLQGLQQQVDRCKNNLQIMLFDEDVATLVRYLDERYYRFEE